MKDTATATKKKRRFPDAVWREVEQRACEGIPLQALADAFGISIATLNDRSKRYSWKTPARLNRRKAALSEEKNTGKKNAIRGQGEGTGSSLADLAAALIAEIDSPPEVFQAALGRVAQHAIARGIASVPPPRSIAELKTFADLHRRAAGLDAKNGNGGIVVLVNPLRSITRSPARVNASGSSDTPCGYPATLPLHGA